MNLTLILTLLVTIVASIPTDGSSFTDICKPTPQQPNQHNLAWHHLLNLPDNPLCHKNSDCGTGCCYNGLCLAYCLHNEDDVHTELVRSLVDGSYLTHLTHSIKPTN